MQTEIERRGQVGDTCWTVTRHAVGFDAWVDETRIASFHTAFHAACEARRHAALRAGFPVVDALEDGRTSS